MLTGQNRRAGCVKSHKNTQGDLQNKAGSTEQGDSGERQASVPFK